MYKIKLKNIKEGLKILLDNPDIVLSVENKFDYNGYGEIKINDSGILEEEFYNGRYSDYKSIIINDRECLIDGDYEENFIYICNNINSNLNNLKDICEYIIDADKDDEIYKYCFDCFYIFLENIINNDENLDKDIKENICDRIQIDYGNRIMEQYRR